MIDLGIKVALGVGVASVALAGYLAFARHQQGIGKAQVTAERQSVVVAKQADVIKENNAKDLKADKVDEHAQAQLTVVAAQRDRAVTAVAGLRDALDRLRADALREETTRASLAAQATAAADGLDECSARYSAVAGERDELSVQVSGLLELAD